MDTKSGFIASVKLICRDKNKHIKWAAEAHDVPIKIPQKQLKGLTNLMKLITNTGMAEAATALIEQFLYIGIGDSSTAESASHTDLQAATNKKRKSATTSRVTTTQTNDTAQWVATFSSADTLSGSWTINEVAVFVAASAGVMLFRKILSVGKAVNWDDGDTIEATGKCQVKQGS